MNTMYCKHQYRQAKAFLLRSNGTVLRCFSTPTFAEITYLIDGKTWQEFDSRLEAPEDEYRLALQTEES